MEKLILIYNWGDETCSGNTTIPVEYSSREEFLFYMYDLYEQLKIEQDSLDEVYFYDLDVFLKKIDIKYLENNVYKLEDWFKLKKIIIKKERTIKYGPGNRKQLDIFKEC